MSKFQSRFPKIGFDVGTCAYDTLVHELKTGITDVAFLLTESVPFSELKSELLGVETLAIISSPDHPLAMKSTLDIPDLGGQSILLPKHDCSYKMIFEQILTEKKVAPMVFMELNSIEAIKQCVLRGIGVAMMPMMAIRQEISQKRLRVLQWTQEQFETGILMIWHKDKWISPILQAFMNMARAEIKSLDVDG
jgi:DNA-binding transcriptional LysR family regulator